LESIRHLAYRFVAWARRVLGIQREANFRRLKIAFVLLCDDNVNRHVRKIQLDILKRHGINEGLSAPPHITLKLGFKTTDIAQFEDYLEELSRTIEPFEISIQGFDVFSEDGILFLNIKRSEALEQLRRRIINDLAERFAIQPYEIEGDKFRFHISVAYGLPKRRFLAEHARHSRTEPVLHFQADSLAILCFAEQNWITYRKVSLRQETNTDLARVVSNSGGSASLDGPTARLLYRRQFFLGPEYIEHLPAWTRNEISPGLRLSTHPDLQVTHMESGGRSLTLLGYILDPTEPNATNAQIIDRLILSFVEIENVVALTASLGGRWIIIARDGQQAVIFNDAAGQRQIYFCRYVAAGRTQVICAAKPGLIAEACNLAPDPEAIDYIRSRGDEDNEVYWMPGDTSLYREVRALLPNHLLHLGSGVTTRYWPTASVPFKSYDQALSESVELLRGLIRSAHNRQSLAVSMTAGWDSRLMLALGREYANSIYYFTLTYPPLHEKSRDVYVPKRLLAKLGLKHHLIRYPSVVDNSFRKIFKQNTSSLHSAYCADAQALHQSYPQQRLCVTGDVAEIVKNTYRPEPGQEKRISGKILADLCEIGDHPFLVAAFEGWQSTIPVVDYVNPYDLFCWEQMVGRWQAKIRAEYDIAQESFAPLNCRILLETMLAVDERRRALPQLSLFRDIIETLWSDTLSVPINPRQKKPLKNLAVDTLRRLHIYQLIPQSLKEVAKQLLTRLTSLSAGAGK